MAVEQIYKPRAERPMLVAGFMSGSGTNLIKILEHQEKLREKKGKSPFEVGLIFTDNKQSNAQKIAEKFGVPLVVHDILDFYRSRGHEDKRDLSLRPLFDTESIGLISGYEIDVVALAGYMSIVTSPLLRRFDGRMINVHPADLCVRDGEKRRYTGDRAVAMAIKFGEASLRSTVHIVREQVDYGEILVVSRPLPVELPEGCNLEDLKKDEGRQLLRTIADEHQERLKIIGDWEIFPKTLEFLSLGKFGFDEDGKLCFNDVRADQGVVLDGPINNGE